MRADPQPDGVTMATVTYGDRADVCLRVAQRAIDEGVGRVILIDNGSSEHSQRALRQWADQRTDVDLIRLPVNGGSATGYRAALERAAVLTDRWVWLLDDDNLPRPGALRAALNIAECREGKVVVACLRSADDSQQAVLAGAGVDATLDVRGSFVGFDLSQRIRRTRIGHEAQSAGSPDEAVEIPWAPYGGLLLPVEAARAVAPPVTEFVLYGDDRDYTGRLRRAGYRILLARNAVVDDLVERWAELSTPSRGHLAGMIASGDRRRAFYLIRNSVFDDVRRAWFSRARLRLLMNALIFSLHVGLRSIRMRQLGFLPLYGHAVLSGAVGRWYPKSRLTTTTASA